MMLRRWLGFLVFVIGVLSVQSASAHANLARSDPPGNTVLAAPPTEIRLWFTEPLEPDFSSITLRDAAGDVVDTPDAQIDPDDPMQMVLLPDDLADGLYTVAWRAVSTSDGHTTQGSFAFAVGEYAPFDTSWATLDETIPPTGAVIRWLNLLSMALAMGGIGFWLLVWQPAIAQRQPDIEKRLRRLMRVGWMALGLSAVLILIYQTTLTQGVDLASINLGAMLLNTRYGALWLARMVLWVLLGAALWRSQKLWLALALLVVLIFTQSLFSHASAAQDQIPAVVNDWAHLVAASLWMGGLLAFALVIGPTRRAFTDSAQTVGHLVAYFSNFGRVIVAALIGTGLYSGWLQVGSVDALLNTVYGRALLIKIILIIPLLLIAAVNLLVTHRALQAGLTIWIKRLRVLVSSELLLGVAVFAAVGVMTSINPAWDVWVFNTAQPETTLPDPYYDGFIIDNTHVNLEINPGLTGENTFTVWLYQHTGEPITDASRIRLRFEHQTENLGESELRAEHQGEGVYTVSGANLSVPGEWRIRTTVSRPNEFDIVVDFEPQIDVQPKPPLIIVDTDFPVSQRLVFSGLTTILLAGVGIFAWRRHWARPVTALLVVGAVVLGVNALILVGIVSQRSGELIITDAWMRPMAAGQNGAVYLTLENGTDANAWVVGARTVVARSVEFHRTQIDGDIARMRPLDSLDIPADGQAILEPVGTHMMLIELAQDFAVGDIFPVTLKLASGEELVVPVRVQLDEPS